MRKIGPLSFFVLFNVGSLFAADGNPKAPSLDETTAIGELRQLGARIDLDDQGHAVSLMWEVGTDGVFTDKQLPQVAKLAHLKELWLEHTAITDTGLVHLKAMKQLESLALICEYKRGKPATITDAGLKHLSGLTKLQVLRLDDSDVTDAGLVHLKPLINLQDLDLCGTEISDAGLVHLRRHKKLEYLGIAETQYEKKQGAVTAKAVRALQTHLPNCDIYH